MPEDHFENIELYLNNELSQDEKKAFERALETDPNLREDFRLYREVGQILSEGLAGSEEQQALKRKLKERQSLYFPDQPASVHHKRKRWITFAAIAAAAAILLFLVWRPAQQDLLNKYGQLKMTNPTVRGDEQDTNAARISQLFNQGKYEEALPLLNDAITAHPDNAQELFFRGVALLHLGKTEDARKDFQVVYAGESIYQYDAAYFMGLSFLQQGDNKKAGNWLEKIPEDAAVHPEAVRLLKKVRE